MSDQIAIWLTRVADQSALLSSSDEMPLSFLIALTSAIFCLTIALISVGVLWYSHKRRHTLGTGAAFLSIMAFSVLCLTSMQVSRISVLCLTSMQVSRSYAGNGASANLAPLHNKVSVLLGAFSVDDMPDDVYCIRHCFRYSEVFRITGLTRNPDTITLTSDSGQVYVMGETGAEELLTTAHITASSLKPEDFNGTPDHDREEQ